MTAVIEIDQVTYDRVDVYRDRDQRVFVSAYAADGSFIATRADNDPDLADLAVAAGALEPTDRPFPYPADDVGGRLTAPVTGELADRLEAALTSGGVMLDREVDDTLVL